MSEIASAFVSLLPSAKGFGKGIESEVKGDVQSAGKRVGAGFGKAFALAGGAVAALGVGAFITDAVKSLARIEQINAQTATVIKSTGGAAKVSAAHVENLAGSLENLTASEAESIQEGANFLLTFKNIQNQAGKGNDIFDQTTRAMVDLSRATGTDMKAASLQLGKALNDPIKGISALGRVGITFSEGQKKTIEGLMESGKAMDAQKIILKELESQFGGSAEAYAKTTQGKIELAEHAFGTLGETMMAGLLPPLGQAAQFTADTLNKMAEDWGPFADKVKAKVGPAFAQISAFVSGSVMPALSQLGATFTTTFLPVLTQVGTFIMGTLWPAFQTLATTLVTSLAPILMQIGSTLIGTLWPALMSVGMYVMTSLWPILQQLASIVMTYVVPAIVAVAGFMVGTLWPALQRIVTQIAGSLKPVFDQLVSTFQSRVLPAVVAIMGKFREWWPTLQRVVSVVVTVVGAVLRFAAAILGKVLPPMIRFAGFLLSKAVPAVLGLIGVIVRVVGAVISFGSAVVGAAVKVGQFVSRVIGTVKTLPTRIIGALSGAATWLLGVGADVVNGLKTGISNAAESAVQSVKDLGGRIVGAAKDAFKIFSPSRVMRDEVGVWLPRGIAVGIVKGTPAALQAAKKMGEKVVQEFKQIRDSVTQAFSADVFGGTVSDLLSGSHMARVMNQAVEGAIPKLIGKGATGDFLTNLLESGNEQLILGLANGQTSTLRTAQSNWNTANRSAARIGTAAAQAATGVADLGDTNKLLASIDRTLKRQEKAEEKRKKDLASKAKKGRKGKKK